MITHAHEKRGSPGGKFGRPGHTRHETDVRGSRGWSPQLVFVFLCAQETDC